MRSLTIQLTFLRCRGASRPTLAPLRHASFPVGRRRAAILPTARHNGATVARIRTLDPQSLTRHVDRLYRAAWGLCGSREDAEDLVQETFARVLARPRKLRGEDELAYLMQVLRNTFLTMRRTASRRPQTGVQLEEGIAADERASSRPEHALEVKELYAAVAELPEDFRLALVAVDILGLSYRDAADALGAREATITTRLFRARKQVVQKLEGAPVAAQQGAQREDSLPGKRLAEQGTL